MELAKHFEHGRYFLHQVARELGDPDDHETALRIVRAVLHTFRDRITLEESLDLVAQLPLLIKGLYVEGWTTKRATRKPRTMQAFAEEVMLRGGPPLHHVLRSIDGSIEASRAVFHVIKSRVSPGEIADIEAGMPKALRELFADH